MIYIWPSVPVFSSTVWSVVRGRNFSEVTLPSHSALNQHMILKWDNASWYMHVTGIKMTGRASKTQIHHQIWFFIWNNLAGNSKFIYQSHTLLHFTANRAYWSCDFACNGYRNDWLDEQNSDPWLNFILLVKKNLTWRVQYVHQSHIITLCIISRPGKPSVKEFLLITMQGTWGKVGRPQIVLDLAEICLLLPGLRFSVALISSPSPSSVRRPQRQRRLVYHSLLGQWCRWTSWRRPGRRPGTSGYPVFGQSSEDYLWCLLYDKSSSIVSFVAALPTTKFCPYVWINRRWW